MVSETVIFIGQTPYHLRNVKRDKDGVVIGGFVINGAWVLKLTDTEMQCKSGSIIVSKWPIQRPILEVPLERNWNGDYNGAIQWAERKIK